MYIYAGIDEAGYGPLFGPLLVGRAVLAVEDLDAAAPPPDMWDRLKMAVCREVSRRRGRLAVNDSKKLYSRSTGLHRLEESVLAFASVAEGADGPPATVHQWLDRLGETAHHDLEKLPWYAPSDDQPWQALPSACTDGELAIARAMLRTAAKAARVKVLDLGAAVVFEDRFNRMVSTMRSKAAANFNFVVNHLDSIWRRFGEHGPTVVVDRQSGRRHYRQLLSQMFSGVQLVELEESDRSSAYRLESGPRRMKVSFEVEADGSHMPVALASMLAKYTRELLMVRFQSWFGRRAPTVKPTAGYATDAKRFWDEIQPVLAELAIDPDRLRRRS